MNEFDLIKRFFNTHTHAESVLRGVGDDCALLQVQPQQAITVTTDSMVEDIHFSSITPIDAIAHKLVVSNMSDIAANGAIPKWATLSLTLTEVNESWLEKFSQSLHAQLNKYNVSLVGGDTTRGAKQHFSMTLIGECNPSHYVSRDKAQAGDIICIGGELGASALGLIIEQITLKNKRFITHSPYQSELEYFLNRFYYPEAQIKLGTLLRKYANAMIDISDGLLQDLTHIINLSRTSHSTLGFDLDFNVNHLPKGFSKIVNYCFENSELDGRVASEEKDFSEMALTSGEEYILCATMSKKAFNDLEQSTLLEKMGAKLYPIGEINNSGTFQINGKELSTLNNIGYQHF